MPRLSAILDNSRVVTYHPAPDEGDGKERWEPSANTNRPANDPVNWLEYIIWCSDFFQFSIASGPTEVTINHAAITGASTDTIQSFPDGAAFLYTGKIETSTHDLYTHSLGYVPKFIVLYNGTRLTSGLNVQTTESGARIVSISADTSKIYLKEMTIVGADGLAAIDVDYEVVIFSRDEIDPSEQLIDFEIATGRLILGRGKVNSDKRYARIAQPFESHFDFNIAPSFDFGQQGVCLVLGDQRFYSWDYWPADYFDGPDHVQIGGWG